MPSKDVICVYYFTGAQFALSNLILRRLKISRFSDLNDPFELLAVSLKEKSKRATFVEIKKEIDKTMGLICFSSSWRNPLLWGHYAEKHTGACIGFEIPRSFLKPVIYAKRLSVVALRSGQTVQTWRDIVGDRILRTKFYDWKYEEEMRLFVELEGNRCESGRYFYSFCNYLVPRKVILGSRCDLPIDEIRRIVGDFKPDVEVIKARIAFSRFGVVEDRLASRAEQ